MEDVSFYRNSDPENLNHHNTFTNKTRDPWVAAYEDDEMFFGTEDTQPKLHDPEVRENAEFNKFDGFEKSVKNLRKCFKILKTMTILSLIQ